MNDQEFLDAVERCTLPASAFRHLEHVRLAWLYLRGLPAYDDAVRAMDGSTRRFAAHHGAAGKYHHTMTVAWMRLVASRLPDDEAGDFERFVGRHPELRDARALMRFYSPELLGSDAARHGWVEPDLTPLPAPGRARLTRPERPAPAPARRR